MNYNQYDTQTPDNPAVCPSCGMSIQQIAASMQNEGMKGLNLIGIASAVVMFICAFLPLLTKIKDYSSESISMLSSQANEAGMMGWMVIVLSVAIAFLYAVQRENLAFFVSMLNLFKFIHVWSVAKKAVYSNDFVHYGFGFYFYLIATVVAILPFILIKVKQRGTQVCPNCGAQLRGNLYSEGVTVQCDEYNENGNVVKQTFYNADGTVSNVYEYDENGNLIE